MRYLSVNEIAKKWNISERSVRNYCAHGRVDGAFLTGKTWNIPENAEKPERSNKKKEIPITLLDILKEQKASKYPGGIYHKTQIDLTYNSNHMEGSRLTHDQTRYIFETNTIGVENEVLNVDDVLETANHFRCIDMIIDNAKSALTEKFIKELHLTLKNGTSDSRKEWFEAMAEIHDCKENLKLVVPSDIEAREEQLAQEIDTESHEKAENFSFFKCRIAIGEEIEYCNNPNIKCKVVGDRKVEYQGKEMSLTAAAKLISGKKYSIAGPRFFKYKGEWLNDIRERIGF